MNVNKLIIIGRVGKTPELRKTQSGKQVCNFSVAVDTGRGEQKTIDWFEVTCWDRTAENAAQYLVKGQEVYAEGPVTVQTYEKRDGGQGAKLCMNASFIQFGDKSKGDDSAEQPRQAPPARPQYQPTPDKSSNEESLDDLPF